MTPSTAPRRDWAHLGEVIRRQRLGAGIRRQKDLAEAVGLSLKTISNYERGRVPETDPAIPDGYYLIAKFFGWTPDSIGTVLAGGDPTPSNQAEKPSQARLSELAEPAFQFVDTARDLGAPNDLVQRARFSLSELIGWLAGHGQRSTEGPPERRQFGLAAYRPHGAGEPIPADDAERIRRRLEEG